MQPAGGVPITADDDHLWLSDHEQLAVYSRHDQQWRTTELPWDRELLSSLKLVVANGELVGLAILCPSDCALVEETVEAEQAPVVVAEHDGAVVEHFQAEQVTRGVGQYFHLAGVRRHRDQPSVVEAGQDAAVRKTHHVLGSVTGKRDASESAHIHFISGLTGFRSCRRS